MAECVPEIRKASRFAANPFLLVAKRGNAAQQLQTESRRGQVRREILLPPMAKLRQSLPDSKGGDPELRAESDRRRNPHGPCAGSDEAASMPAAPSPCFVHPRQSTSGQFAPGEW